MEENGYMEKKKKKRMFNVVKAWKVFSFGFGTRHVDEVDDEHMLDEVLGSHESRVFMEVLDRPSGTEQVPKSR